MEIFGIIAGSVLAVLFLVGIYCCGRKHGYEDAAEPIRDARRKRLIGLADNVAQQLQKAVLEDRPDAAREWEGLLRDLEWRLRAGRL